MSGIRLLGCLGGLIIAGCSMHKDAPLARPSTSGVLTVEPADVAWAEDAPEPAILPATYLAAGRLFQSHGQFTNALEQYKKALNADPDYLEAYHRLGIMASSLGRHAEAETALRRAIQIDPGSASLRNNLGFEYTLQRKWVEAEREFRRAIFLDPDSHRSYVNLGIAVAAQGRFEDALTEFLRMLPEADAYYNLGLAYRAHQHYDEAATAFSKVLALDPGFQAARQQLEHLRERGSPPGERAGQDGRLHDAGATGSLLPVISDNDARADEPPVAPATVEPAQAAAFAPQESFIEALTLVDWAGIRDTLADKPPVAPEPSVAPEPPVAPSDVLADARPGSNRPPAGSRPPAGGYETDTTTPRPGDFDGDGDVDQEDAAEFHSCFYGVGVPTLPGCEAGDFDRDGDVDVLDYLRFQAAFPRP